MPLKPDIWNIDGFPPIKQQMFFSTLGRKNSAPKKRNLTSIKKLFNISPDSYKESFDKLFDTCVTFSENVSNTGSLSFKPLPTVQDMVTYDTPQHAVNYHPASVWNDFKSIMLFFNNFHGDYSISFNRLDHVLNVNGEKSC